MKPNRGSISRSISHESSTAQFNTLVTDPARLVSEYTAMILPAAVNATKHPHQFILRLQLCEMLLGRISESSISVDPNALENLKALLSALRDGWEQSTLTGSDLVEAALKVAEAGARGVLKPRATPPVVVVDHTTPGNASTEQTGGQLANEERGLVVAGPDELPLTRISGKISDGAIRRILLDSEENTFSVILVIVFAVTAVLALISGTVSIHASSPTAAAISFTTIAITFVATGVLISLRSRYMCRLRALEFEYLQFLNQVFQANQVTTVAGVALSSNSPIGRGSVLTADSGLGDHDADSDSALLVPMMKRREPPSFLPAQIGSQQSLRNGPDAPEEQSAEVQVTRPDSGSETAAATAGDSTFHIRIGKMEPVPQPPPAAVSKDSETHPNMILGIPTVQEISTTDRLGSDKRSSLTSDRLGVKQGSRRTSFQPPSPLAQTKMYSSSNPNPLLPSPDRPSSTQTPDARTATATPNQHGPSVFWTDDDTKRSKETTPAVTQIPIPPEGLFMVQTEDSFAMSSRSNRSPPVTPLAATGTSPRTQLVSDSTPRIRAPRSPGRSPSARLGHHTSSGRSVPHLMVPLSLGPGPLSSRSRKASVVSMMESSLTDPQSIIHHWSNSPVGQMEVASLDDDFNGALNMKLMISDNDRTKTQVRINGSALHQNMILIGVKDDGEVFMWNTCAVASTGLSVQDALHKKIDNFLADDFSISMVKKLITAVEQGKSVPVCRLKIVSLLNCTASIRATATSVERGDGAVVGTAIIAKQEEEIDKTNNVFLTRYRNAEVISELRSLPPNADFLDLKGRLKRIEQIVEHSTWDYVSNVAYLMMDWEPVSPEQVVSEIARVYLSKVDIIVAKNLPELVECDLLTIQGILREIADKAIDNFTMNIRCIQLGHVGSVSCIEVLMSGILFRDIEEDLLRNKELNRCVDAVCGTLWASLPSDQPNQTIAQRQSSQLSILGSVPPTPTGQTPPLSHRAREAGRDSDRPTVTFRFPCSQLQNLNQSTGTDSTGHTPLSPSFAAPQVPLTFMLYENKTIFRHNISSTIWGRGHALCVVDGPRSAERTIRSGLREVHAAIVDLDGTKSSTGILNLLKAHPNIKVFTCGQDATPPNPNCPNYQIKPLTRGALQGIIEQVSKLVEQKQKEENEIEKQRSIFSQHHRSPWIQGKKLGAGAFADVYEAESTLTGGKMAVKCLWLESIEEGTREARVKELLNEIEIMCKLSHPNIVHYLYCEKGAVVPGRPESVNLFMELCDGTLQKMIETRAPLPPYDIAKLLTEIVRAVSYLHENNIVHRDLKPQNVLMRDGHCKISDFGTAAKVAPITANSPSNSSNNDHTGHLTDVAGTLKYMAPEVILQLPYGTACDLWAIGIITLELLGMPPPFLKGKNSFALVGYYENLYRTASESEAPVQPELPESLQGDARNFVSLCLTVKQKHRPAASSLLVHPFLQETTQVTSVPTYRRNSHIGLMPSTLPPRRMSRLPDIPELIEPGGGASGSSSNPSTSRTGSKRHLNSYSPSSALNLALNPEESAAFTCSVVSDIIVPPSGSGGHTPPSTHYVFPVEETPRNDQPDSEQQSQVGFTPTGSPRSQSAV